MSYLIWMLIGFIGGLLFKPLFWKKFLRPVFVEWGMLKPLPALIAVPQALGPVAAAVNVEPVAPVAAPLTEMQILQNKFDALLAQLNPMGAPVQAPVMPVQVATPEPIVPPVFPKAP